MIEFYINNKSLNTNIKINECYDYYLNKNMSYDKLYEEYDTIKKLKPKIEFTSKNIFFKNDKLKNIKTVFMKECLLESIKRLLEYKSDIDINNSQSQLNKLALNSENNKGDTNMRRINEPAIVPYKTPTIPIFKLVIKYIFVQIVTTTLTILIIEK